MGSYLLLYRRIPRYSSAGVVIIQDARFCISHGHYPDFSQGTTWPYDTDFHSGRLWKGNYSAKEDVIRLSGIRCGTSRTLLARFGIVIRTLPLLDPPRLEIPLHSLLFSHSNIR